MTDMTDDQVKALLDGATPGRRVQFHGSYCPEAVGTPFTDWDTSHDMSVIRPDGSRYRLAHYKHASDAYLSQMAPDLARALLDARAELAATQTQVGDWIVRADEANVKVEKLEAELARVRADAAVVVALMVERAVDALEGQPRRVESLGGQSTSYIQLGEAVTAIRALAPADGLAAVGALRVEARENAMQALASMGQAQEAYEAQLEAEAELAAAQQREAALTKALEACVASLERVDTAEGVCCCGDSMDRHSDPMSCGHSPVDMGDYYAGQALESARAALAQTIDDPADGWTWNERLGWIGPDGKPADPRRRG